jgi:hypothetical protein
MSVEYDISDHDYSVEKIMERISELTLLGKDAAALKLLRKARSHWRVLGYQSGRAERKANVCEICNGMINDINEKA